jgi:serine/threonine protein kinase
VLPTEGKMAEEFKKHPILTKENIKTNYKCVSKTLNSGLMGCVFRVKQKEN